MHHKRDSRRNLEHRSLEQHHDHAVANLKTYIYYIYISTQGPVLFSIRCACKVHRASVWQLQLCIQMLKRPRCCCQRPLSQMISNCSCKMWPRIPPVFTPIFPSRSLSSGKDYVPTAFWNVRMYEGTCFRDKYLKNSSQKKHT